MSGEIYDCIRSVTGCPVYYINVNDKQYAVIDAEEWEVEITGLRNPCRQLDDFQTGLLAAVLDRDDEGNLIRKVGVMGVVFVGGAVRPGDTIQVTLPPEPHQPLVRV